MKSFKYFLLAVFAIAIKANGQELIITKQCKIDSIVSMEKTINKNPQFLNQNVSLTSDYFPLYDKYPVTNPMIIQRDASGYLPLYAEYYFTPKDSIVRFISYDWEKEKYANYMVKQKMWGEESSKLETYNQEYERIKKILLEKFGKPLQEDQEPKKTKGSSGSSYSSRETVWTTEDYQADLSMVFASNTFRIRFIYYWKK